MIKSYENLKKMRNEKGYSCKKMAELLNMSETYYWQIENGKRGLYYEIAKNIAKIFELKPDDIFYK